MKRIGYFLVESRDEDEISEKENALKKFEVSHFYADNTSVNYRERGKLRHAIDSLRPGDVLVLDTLECLGTTVREISSNMKYVKSRGARYFIANKNPDLAFGKHHFDYIETAHELLLFLSRHRGERGYGKPKRVSRKHQKKGAGRPPLKNRAMIEEARAWITESTKVEDIQIKWNISRSTAYRLLNTYQNVFDFDIERQRQEWS
ncbi:recombinase family protein [Rhizobium rhizogenes]|uniref:Resolvase/invertase-type recombinase catalytic domain-containing protein n=1 Tax=Rhizobium rhizogenes TaxID=359 RepID=A0AA92H706_RHIRH|nr:recombinase family protein [Rhizobium rhizogenes]PVE49869.1 hypothetical protein DC430_23510 [Rhizobium rhizogenes]PVE62005.1 hypothetical protein DC415_23950 [Agrobacterium tumefaciens]PVE69769.1 hypothetical protein DCP16_23950 [Sphingomonas sp. TPD3009]